LREEFVTAQLMARGKMGVAVFGVVLGVVVVTLFVVS
jgi:hypothetical protein